ncbi:hypothetical protein FRC01_000715, partial [Tulasnella sp. 417]
MADAGLDTASPAKKKHAVREDERFSRIYDALPPHLRQADVPKPLKALSTPENEPLARFPQATEDGRPPSEALANIFDDHLRRTVEAATASSPESPLGSGSSSLLPLPRGNISLRTCSQGVSTRAIQPEGVDALAESRSSLRTPTDLEDDSNQHDVDFRHNDSVVPKDELECSDGRRQDDAHEICKRATTVRHTPIASRIDENSGHESPAMKSSRPPVSTIDPYTQSLLSGDESPKSISVMSRSREEEERPRGPEEPAEGIANLPTNRVGPKRRIEYRHPSGPQISMNEARNAVAGSARDESTAESSENHQGNRPNGDRENASHGDIRPQRRLPDVEDLQQPSSSASSPLVSIPGTKSCQNSQISYDDGVQNDGHDMGDTSTGHDPENIGPTTPGPVSGDKRKRGTPSTGGSDGPATKHQRPGIESEDPSSPLSQNRFRTPQYDAASNLRQPVRRWSTEPSLRDSFNFEAMTTINGRTSGSSNSVPGKETTDVTGGSSTPGVKATLSRKIASSTALTVPDRAGDTKDDGRAIEPQSPQIPTTHHQTSTQVVAQRMGPTKETRGLPHPRRSLLSAMGTAVNGIQASTLGSESSLQASTSLSSSIRSDLAHRINATSHVESMNSSNTTKPPRPSSPGAPASQPEPSTTSVAAQNGIRLASHRGDGIPQPDPNATPATHPIESPRVRTSSNPTFDGL